MTITRHRSALYEAGELSCLYCGHETAAPEWDAHSVPRCPRCAARLFIQLRDGSRHAHVAGHTRRHKTQAKTNEEREDAYEREDVYVGAPEIAD
jgi:DNA-directed RNA polymerase subunit RPC12/RpoP